MNDYTDTIALDELRAGDRFTMVHDLSSELDAKSRVFLGMTHHEDGTTSVRSSIGGQPITETIRPERWAFRRG